MWIEKLPRRVLKEIIYRYRNKNII